MRIGVVFPQAEIGSDGGAVRAYATRVEELGYDHVLVYDHVLGADREIYRGWTGPYDVDTPFHEPFVLYGYLAASTSLELATSVIILPQRQAALVAKQAAEVDLLTGGRFRLGVGLGWNAVEYEALGMDFTTRGARITEQVEVLRKLWTQRSVTHIGRFEKIIGAGIAPLPVQRPIPLWFGAASPTAYRRAGSLADGWFPQMPPGPELDAAIAIVREAAVRAARDPADLGMEGRVSFTSGGQAAAVVKTAAAWRTVGATHIAINTMGAGFRSVDEHLDALAAAAPALLAEPSAPTAREGHPSRESRPPVG
jgi:probable F420-dependent oxidoreductase